MIDYLFKQAGVEKPKDKKMAWIIAASLVHYGVHLPKYIDKLFKSKYYKTYNEPDSKAYKQYHKLIKKEK